jgi:hypothetical protein
MKQYKKNSTKIYILNDGKLVYASYSLLNQEIKFTNILDKVASFNGDAYTSALNDNNVRESYILNENNCKGRWVWYSDRNSDHYFNFWIETKFFPGYVDTNSWSFHDVDYSKGIVLDADSNYNDKHIWSNIYYSSSNDGSPQHYRMDYRW